MTRTAGIAALAGANALALLPVLVLLAPVLFGPLLAPVADAYADDTVPIDVRATCAADGWCQPEIYVERADPAQPATVQVNYTPSWDPMAWNLTLRNVAYILADARLNYETRGCAVFFADCPETEYLRWLLNNDELLVNLDADATLRFRATHVPMPSRATLDGRPFVAWSWDGDGVTAYEVAPGVHALRIYLTSSGGGGLFGDPLEATALFAVVLLGTVLVVVATRRRNEE